MSIELEYNTYVQNCKKNRVHPIAYDLWVEHKKSGSKYHIGFDSASSGKDYTVERLVRLKR